MIRPTIIPKILAPNFFSLALVINLPLLEILYIAKLAFPHNTHLYQLPLQPYCTSQWSSSPPSSSFFMHAFILLWWCGLLVTSVVGGNNETDRLALLEFKAKITHDPLQLLSSWNDSIHFCQWRGVTCGRRHQRVIVLDLLQFSELVGSISPHVGNLSFLKKLSLSGSSFHNEIPSEIDRLRRLQFLQLYNNTHIGKIPRNLSHCTNLNYINFGRNLLDGEIPTTLGTLSKLQIVSFEGNNLTGSIPSFFGCLEEFLPQSSICLRYRSLM
ncbi:hypothetical protein CMV_027113 [Castanea mollissima]|uniref:Leucine-rich repeat-containing N-terminal plant-type domain-containing protein n=1 Tax=Castanea mollissima TaxID=60419 RepID=A0A8J4V9Q6_9ROSI|nr:hypothetical protein CMV_027113 [Castanea mollissima]